MQINKFIDHTLLKPTATQKDIKQLCEEAIKYNFFSVCVNPCYVSYAKKLLNGTDVEIACVVGFPLGQNLTTIKCEEAKLAAQNGADEIDMVINIAKLKDKDYSYVLDEINQVKNASLRLVKVIIETSQLTKEEIAKMCEIVNKSNAECIKTSTGFVGDGAKQEDVELMAKLISSNKFVKASGGIRDYKTAKQMIELGAKRLGCSAGVKIMQESLQDNI